MYFYNVYFLNYREKKFQQTDYKSQPDQNQLVFIIHPISFYIFFIYGFILNVFEFFQPEINLFFNLKLIYFLLSLLPLTLNFNLEWFLSLMGGFRSWLNVSQKIIVEILKLNVLLIVVLKLLEYYLGYCKLVVTVQFLSLRGLN